MRIWDNGAGTDPSALLRYNNNYSDRLGDNIGNYENDIYGAHNHLLGSYALAGSGTDKNCEGSRAESEILTSSIQPTSTSGGNETRPINISLNAFIKF